MVYSDQIVAVKFHIFAFFYDRRMKVRQISRQSHAYKLRYIILADKSETRFLLLGCYHIKMATREIPFFFFFLLLWRPRIGFYISMEEYMQKISKWHQRM